MHSTSRYWVEQLARTLADSDRVAQRAGAAALEAARTLSTAAEQKEDARAALEFGGLAHGHSGRARAVQAQLTALRRFYEQPPPPPPPGPPAVRLGSLVDVAREADDDPAEACERSFIVLPVGAGTELTGPGGDGFLTVITPASPLGQALMGRRRGDVVDLRRGAEVVAWLVTEIC